MNLEDLRLFVAVAQAGSFTGAALTLHIPKSTLSRRIAAFEQALGVPLVHRSTRRFTLSEGGRQLLQRSAPLLEELELAGEETRSLQRQPAGVLRLQVPAELLADDLARLLSGFAADHPEITVHCSHYVRSTLINPDDFDLTLLGYEWRLPASDWISVPFLSLRQGVFAAPGSVPRQPLSLQQLQELPALLPVDEPLWHFRVGAGIETVAMSASLHLDGPVMRLRAAEHGTGIVKAPLLLADAAVRSGRLVALDVAHEPVALSVALYYRSRALPARMRAFIDYLQSNLVRFDSAHGARL